MAARSWSREIKSSNGSGRDVPRPSLAERTITDGEGARKSGGSVEGMGNLALLVVATSWVLSVRESIRAVNCTESGSEQGPAC
jgi:hypothetical protein